MRLDINQHHIQKLSARVEQSVRILQMDSQRLEEYLSDLMLENPIIEAEYPSEQDWPIPGRKKTIAGDRDVYDIAESIPDPRSEEGLIPHLLSQVRRQFSGEDAKLLRYLIGFIDDNGYLSPTFEAICAMGAYPRERLTFAKKLLQALDPPGVGASDLRECLCLQLREGEAVERRLVQEHLEDIAAGNTQYMAKKLKLSIGRIEKAVQRIKALSPKPGQSYGGEPPQYINPDIVVYKTPGRQFEVALVQGSLPRLLPNRQYIDMLQRTADPEIRQYLQSKLDQFNWVRKCLEKRESTIIELSRAIISRQERFFRYGPSFLNSFRMKDAADMLGVHESTVSRAVHGKWLLCSHGTFPLKAFFVRSVHQDSIEVSVLDARREIARVIRDESSSSPFSDQHIALCLKARGIEISRRTVAKYRSELGIPPAYIRSRGMRQ